MKNIDNRGFVMVETIIVAVFVISICTFLFANFLPLIGDYERVSNYDTLGAKYKIHEIRKMILRELYNHPEVEVIFTDMLNDDVYNQYLNYKEELSGKTNFYNRLCDVLINSKNYCNELLGADNLDVKEIYITSFKLGEMKNAIKKMSGNRELKEYIEYLPSYSKSSNDDYRLIVVFNNGEMANIEVHYEIG